MPFGKANYSPTNGFNIFAIKGGDHGATGHNFYRLMPPYGKQLATGRIMVRQAQHFGYYGVGSGDEGKPVPRPFGCIEKIDYKTKMVLVECAECSNIKNKKALRDNLEAQLKTQGKSETEVKEACKEYDAWLKSHNIDAKYYAAAMNQKREFGVLKIPYKAKEKLDTLFVELQDKEGIDATDVDQGVWFDFKRSGEGFKTVYDVEVYREDKVVDGVGRVKVLKVEPLSVEEQDKALALLPELTDIIRVLTAEQIAQLVQSGGDPHAVDTIMGIGQKQEGGEAPATPRTTAPTPALNSRATPTPTPTPTPQRTAAPAPATPAATPTVAMDDEEAELERKLAAKRAAKAAAAAAASSAPAPTPMTAAPAQAADNFIAEFGFDPGK